MMSPFGVWSRKRIVLLQINSSSFLFQEFTQGPCPLGQLILLDRASGNGICSCNSSLVRSCLFFQIAISKVPAVGWEIPPCAAFRLEFFVTHELATLPRSPI